MNIGRTRMGSGSSGEEAVKSDKPTQGKGDLEATWKSVIGSPGQNLCTINGLQICQVRLQ